MENKAVKKYIRSGISPLEIKYAAVKYTSGSNLAAYRSFLQINSLEVGALLPEQYGEVANRNILGSRLSAWALNTVCNDIISLEMYSNKYEFISVYMPTKTLISGSAIKTIKKCFDRTEFSFAKKICIEFSSDILFYESDEVIAKLDELKALGVKTAICDFGDDFCPMMRLKGLPFDVVFLHNNIGTALINNEPQANSVIKLCADMGYMTVIVGDFDSEALSRAYYLNCEAFHSSKLHILGDIAFLGGDADE